MPKTQRVKPRANSNILHQTAPQCRSPTSPMKMAFNLKEPICRYLRQYPSRYRER
ncbi:unnamed protein product [Acanthoscelides obtectus]|uniref:Uncharacterized protein n=2 Tax=Acanthoscelides obtectus TaxID=200917 RepID=A0A9P0Q5B0_ACAOB|nr:unnamed protein product [Acanthoscelides obtectus]CAK1677680.1 hypothetical protein AOBTE_LOCUS31483 [Acanthoscelides obtectus]